MFLEQITIEGFLSYRDKQVIDLSNVSTCLVLGQINGDPELSNGAGKSSLFEAILVNFFGKSLGRSDVLDSYINDSMSKMQIEVIFKLDNQRFKTLRTKKRSSSTSFEISLDSTNTEFCNATWKKIDKTIEEVLGLSSKTYNSTIYLNERESLKIITGTSSDRKEILRELLDIEIYEKAFKISSKKFDEYDKKMLVNLDMIKDRQTQLEDEELIRNSLLDLQKKLQVKKQFIETLSESLKEKNKEKLLLEIDLKTQKVILSQIQQKQKDLDTVNSSKKKTNNEIQDLDKEVIEQNEKLKNYKLKIDKQAEQKPQFKKDALLLDDQLRVVDQADEQIKAIREELRLVSEQIKAFNVEINEKYKQKSNLNSSLEVIKAEKKPINDLLARLDEFENVCPITLLECSVLNKNYKNNIIEQKKLEIKQLDLKKEDLEKQIKLVEEQTKNIKINVGGAEKQTYQLTAKEHELSKTSRMRQSFNNSLMQLKLKQQSLDNDENNFKQKNIEFGEYIEQSKNDINDLKKSLKEIETNIIEIQKSKKELEIVLSNDIQVKVDKLNQEIKEVEQNIFNINSENEACIQKIGEMKNSLTRLEKMKLEIEHMFRNNEDNIKQKAIFQSLTTIFGKDGIQKSLMKEAIPLLEKYTLEFLKIFNDDSEKLRIKFDLDPKRQDGEFKKGGGLDILVLEDDKEPKDLQMYSGGETVRIVFSIVLALAKLLSLRAGKRHESLIIDEKIAKLDARGIEQFGEVIKEISKIYKQVFVITHIDSLKDLISGNQLIVNKTDNDGSIVSLC